MEFHSKECSFCDSPTRKCSPGKLKFWGHSNCIALRWPSTVKVMQHAKSCDMRHVIWCQETFDSYVEWISAHHVIEKNTVFHIAVILLLTTLFEGYRKICYFLLILVWPLKKPFEVWSSDCLIIQFIDELWAVTDIFLAEVLKNFNSFYKFSIIPQ